MSEITQHIREWADEALAGSDCFVCDIKHNHSTGKISLYIDADDGVNIYRCADLAHFVNEKLNALDPEHNFSMEVSSPGADKPLKFLRQYVKHVGRKLDIKTKDGKELQDMLKEVKEGSIVIGEKVTNLLTKRKPRPDVELTFDEIETASVVVGS